MRLTSKLLRYLAQQLETYLYLPRELSTWILTLANLLVLNPPYVLSFVPEEALICEIIKTLPF